MGSRNSINHFLKNIRPCQWKTQITLKKRWTFSKTGVDSLLPASNTANAASKSNSTSSRDSINYYIKTNPLRRSKIQKPLKNIKLIEKLVEIRPYSVPTQFKPVPSRTRWALDILWITFSKPSPLPWSKIQITVKKRLKNVELSVKPVAIRSFPVPAQLKLLPSRTRRALDILWITISKSPPLCRWKIPKPLKNIKLLEKPVSIRSYPVPAQLRLLPSRTRRALDIQLITFSKSPPFSRWKPPKPVKILANQGPIRRFGSDSSLQSDE